VPAAVTVRHCPAFAARPEIAKFVVVAFVVVAFVPKKLVRNAFVAKKFVVVAFVDVLFVEMRLVLVALTKSASAKCDVDEAKMPFCAKSTVVVAEVFTPKLIVGVNGHAAMVPEVR